MALKDESLRERVVKVEAEVGLLTDIAKRLPEDMQNLKKELAGDMQNLRRELTETAQDLRKELAEGMQGLRKEMSQGFQILREEISQCATREEFNKRADKLEQKMDKITWWILGVMLAVLMAVIFKH